MRRASNECLPHNDANVRKNHQKSSNLVYLQRGRRPHRARPDGEHRSRGIIGYYSQGLSGGKPLFGGGTNVADSFCQRVNIRPCPVNSQYAETLNRSTMNVSQNGFNICREWSSRCLAKLRLSTDISRQNVCVRVSPDSIRASNAMKKRSVTAVFALSVI